MRADGTRVKNLTPIVQALPYIMPKRYDAQNWASDYVDEDVMKDYIRRKRREGRIVTHMSVLVAAYYKAALENPKVNYFIMNRKVYKRNHFCFSFVILKTRADGTPDETALKVFLEPEDDVFTITGRSGSTWTKTWRRSIITTRINSPTWPFPFRDWPGSCSGRPTSWTNSGCCPGRSST